MANDVDSLRDSYRKLRAPASIERAVLEDFEAGRGQAEIGRLPLIATAMAVVVLATAVVLVSKGPKPTNPDAGLSLASLQVPARPNGFPGTRPMSPRRPGTTPKFSNLSTPTVDWSRL